MTNPTPEPEPERPETDRGAYFIRHPSYSATRAHFQRHPLPIQRGQR